MSSGRTPPSTALVSGPVATADHAPSWVAPGVPVPGGWSAVLLSRAWPEWRRAGAKRVRRLTSLARVAHRSVRTARVARSACPGLLLALLCAGGCANGRVSEQDSVRGVVHTFLAQCAEQRVLRVQPTLVPAAQRLVAEAGPTTRGCARVLGLPGGSAPPARAFGDATIALRRFNGARADVAVGIAGTHTTVSVSRGSAGWRIEAS